MGHFDKISEILLTSYGPKHRKLKKFVDFGENLSLKISASFPLRNTILFYVSTIGALTIFC